MPKQIIEDQIWRERLIVADRYYKTWERLFRCETLEKYYEGFQWQNTHLIDYNPYTINKIFETIQLKIAALIPSEPRFTVTARQAYSEFNLELAANSANIKQDVINTLISNPDANFAEELEAAYTDSFFRFGIIEVGYDADWYLNPNAQKPALAGDNKVTPRNPKSVISEPEEIPLNERVYFKHVPAKSFRVGGVNTRYLTRTKWCGYYEYVDIRDIQGIKNLMNEDKFYGYLTTRQEQVQMDDERGDNNAVKLWKLWDLRNKVLILFLDDPGITIFQRKYQRLPLFDYRPVRRVIGNHFYPVPPVWHWLSSQDEINEIREQLRNHRRRFVRKFQVLENSVSDEEKEKFETGGDGALIEVKRENAIVPIQNADLGSAVNLAQLTSTDDLNKISGTSSEMRGVSDRTTATQAGIIDRRSSMREGADKQKIYKWFNRIAREALLIARDKFSLGMWAKYSADPGETFLSEVQLNTPAYRFVTSEELDDSFDFTVEIDVTTMSPASQEEEKRHFIEFLSITAQFPQVAFSPILIREAAYRVGYRNERVIREMQQMALLQTLGQAIQNGGGPFPAGNSGAAATPGGNPYSQQIVANQTPPDMEEVRNQIRSQILT